MAAVEPLSASPSLSDHLTGPAHPEKRRKITRACDNCKAKKKRCTGTQPCPSCEKATKPCTYLASYTRGRYTTPPSSRGLDALLLAAESHNVNFAERGGRRDSSARTSDVNAASPVLSRGPQSPPETAAQRHHSLSSTYGHSPGYLPTQPSAPTYPPHPNFQAPPSNNVRRTSVYPPLSVNEQWRPPSVQEPMSKEVSRRPSPEPDGNFDGHYLGPSSGIAWLRRALRKLGQARSLKETLSSESSHEGARNFSIFTHGDKSPPSVSSPGLSLPCRARMDHLVSRYFEYAAPTYRFLHRPTLISWLSDMHNGNGATHPAKQAIVLVILALATVYEISRLKGPELDLRYESEMYYREAESLLAQETGPGTLESVQARFAICHYLLSTARSNQAWFTFGITVQLAMALGLHRKRAFAEKNSLITRECQRRLFWSIYTLDRYLSVIFGRPKMLRDDDITQEFPVSVNDEDLTATKIIRPARDDCLEDAAIFHSQLACILGRAANEQYTMHARTEAARVGAAVAHNNDLNEWKSKLPPFLSGSIKPSSLIPIFRRQSTVLKIAHAHAVMLVNRPFLLSNFAKGGSTNGVSPQATTREFVDECLGAARTALEMVLVFVAEGQPFASFWLTQYIAFNALSIIYLYLLQSRRQGNDILNQQRDLLALADTCQQYLADVTETNAPSMRYSIILEELRDELSRQATTNTTNPTAGFVTDGTNALLHSDHPHFPTAHLQSLPSDSSILLASTDTRGREPLPDGATRVDGDGSGIGDLHQLDWDLDFWPQLDSLPMSYSNWNGPFADFPGLPNGR